MASTRPDKFHVLSETEKLAAESHLAVAKSLIVLEEVRALRARVDPTPEEIFNAVTRRQLDQLDQVDDGSGSDEHA